MIGTRDSQAFAADNRAVSAVIGFILIFGILVLLLTVYQAQIVPQQNAQTEFEHFEDTENELVELRNAISTAGQADVSQFSSVRLGTTYQSRLLTINPAPPVGTLQTSDEYNITISNGTAEHDLNISTRFLEYQPGYNELDVGLTQYEHSVLYLDERDRGNNVSVIEDQNLVKDGTVRITALQNEFQQTGTNRITLELYPEDDVDGSEFPEQDGENLNVTIPTQLDEDEYWNDALDDVGSIYQGTEEHGEIHALNLSVDEDDLEVNTVGIQLEPDEGAAKNTDPQGGGGIGGNGNGENEPALNAEAESPVEEDDQSEITVSAEFSDGDPVPDEDIEIDVNDPGEDAFIRAIGEDPGDNKIVNVGTSTNDDPLVVTTDDDGNFGTAEDDNGEEFDVDRVDYDVSASSEEAGDTVELELQANDQIEVTETEEIDIGGAVFADITATPDDRGSTDVRGVDFTFDIDGDTEGRSVRVEGVADGGEQDEETVSADQGSAEIDWGGGGSGDDVSVPIELTVELREDGGSTIDTCTATVEENDETLDFDDFNCD